MTVRCVLLVMIVLMAGTARMWATTPPSGKSGQIPPAFENNVGQARYHDGTRATHVDALYGTPSGMAYVHRGGMHVVTTRTAADDAEAVDMVRTDFEFVGSNPASRYTYSLPHDAYVRYLTEPGDGSEGRIAQRYGRILYHDVWPGIDVRMTTQPSGVKVDYIVHPGADPSRIALRIAGATMLARDGQELLIGTALGELREGAPYTFTSVNGTTALETVPTAYRLDGNVVRFDVGDYDRTRTLVIDPRRLWASYFGFSAAMGTPKNAVDLNGNIYIAGTTLANDLPRSAGVLQRALKDGLDGYVAKFNDEKVFQWCTYLGGSASDRIQSVTTDGNGHVFVCGRTESPYASMPFRFVGSGAFGDPPSDSTRPAESDGFVTELLGTGAEKDFWYFYGKGADEATDIAVRGDYMAVTGFSASPRLCERNGAPFTHSPDFNFAQNDIWTCRIRRNANGRWNGEWLAFLGGKESDAGVAVALDADNNVIVLGNTEASGITGTDGSVYKGGTDIVICKFTTAGLTPAQAWCSVIGGTMNELPTDLAVDLQNNVIIAGYSTGATMPVANALMPNADGPYDGFIRKHAANGTMMFSTYFGANGSERIRSVGTDLQNNIWIAGEMDNYSTAPPVTNDAYQKAPYKAGSWGTTDGFFAQVAADGQKILYCTLYGSPAQTTPPLAEPPAPPATATRDPKSDYGTDIINSIVIEGSAYIHLLSLMESLSMDTTANAYQGRSALRTDVIQSNAFLSTFTNCPDSVTSITTNGPTGLCGGSSTQLLGPAGFARYQWSNGGTGRSITVATAGTYILVSTTANGCRYKDTVVITANPAPIVVIADSIVVCKDTLTELVATVSAGTRPYKYKWNRLESGPDYIDSDTAVFPKVNPPTDSRYVVTVTDSNGCTAQDTVRIVINIARPLVTPASVDFGTMGSCESSVTHSIDVTNPMPYPIAINGFESDLTIITIATSIATPVVIRPGETIPISLRVSPTVPGTTTGHFTLVGSPCSWKYVSEFKVSKATIKATVAPSTISFGTSRSCEPADRDTTVAVTNGSANDITLKPATVLPAGQPFTVDLAQDVLIPAGTSATVHIRYAPVATGVFQAAVRIPFVSGTCEDTLTVPLQGTRNQVAIQVMPAAVDFGTITGCTASVDTAITITNTGDDAIGVTLPALEGVTYQPAGPYTLAAHDSIAVRVTITPAVTGAFTATVMATSAPCNITAASVLSGVKEGQAFSVTESIDLGELTSCGPVTAQAQITLSFQGMGAATIAMVETGPSIQTTAVAGEVLQPNAPLNRNVIWRPTADGALVDSVVVTFQPCGIRRVIRVTGTKTSVALAARTPAVFAGQISGTRTGTIFFDNTGTDTVSLAVTARTNNVTVVSTIPADLTQLLPGASVEVAYELHCAGSATTLADTIDATTTAPCPATASTGFSAACATSRTTTCAVVIDTVTVNTGDRFVLPIRITASRGLEAAGARAFTATVRYNPGVIVGRDGTPDCFSGTYEPCTIAIAGERGSDTVGVLANLEFTAILGTDVHTIVELVTFAWTGVPEMNLTTETGGVTIGNICMAGGTARLLDGKAPLTIRVGPVPATSAIQIDIEGSGREATSVVLYDVVGTHLSSLTLHADADGRLHHMLDVSHLAAGSYAITVTAGAHTSRSSIIIVR